MTEPSVSVVIVNFNAGPLLENCLRSLDSQTFTSFEVIVVDNASRDDSITAIGTRTYVRVANNDTNIGYAAAQNQGMRLGLGKHLMALNFDVELAPDYIAHLLDAMESNPHVGTATGKLLRLLPNGERTKQLDNAGLLLTKRRMPEHRGGAQIDRGQFDEQTYVFGAMAAAAMYRREMLEDIAIQGHYYDESFFTWYEDVDLDWRGRLYGWECLYVPDAVGYHIRDPQGNLATAFATQMTIRNRWQMILANECLSGLITLAPWLLLEEIALLQHVIRTGQLPAYLRAVLDLLAHLPNVLTKRRRVRAGLRRRCLPTYPRIKEGKEQWTRPLISSA